jgi:hypothetical protein
MSIAKPKKPQLRVISAHRDPLFAATQWQHPPVQTGEVMLVSQATQTIPRTNTTIGGQVDSLVNHLTTMTVRDTRRVT